MEDKYIEDEISLKELIMHLIDYKQIIAVITVIALVLGGVYAFVLADEVYGASVEGTIIITETASSKYGTFNFPSTFKQDFLGVVESEEVLNKVIKNLELDFSTQVLKDKITVASEKDSSNFKISVKDENKESAIKLLNEISKVYVDAINMKYKKLAVDLFERDYYVQIRTLGEEVEKQEVAITGYREQLKTIQPTITLKKLVTSDPELAAKLAKDSGTSIESLSEAVMLEQISNPNYELLEDTIIKAESILVDLQTSMEQNQKLYEELLEEKAAISSYYATGDIETLNDGSLEFMKSRISISSYVSASDNPVAPRKSLILAISAVMGLMIGVFAAFFKAYWKNN